MSGGLTITASPHSYSVCSPPSTIHRPRFSVAASTQLPLFSLNLKFPRINCRCNSTGDSGENESRTILDAFFLGKAVGEALNERIESAVGEFLSTIGRLQAEQQKQVQEFLEDVLEKARLAKEQAAREAMEAQGLIPNPTVVETPAVNGVASKAASPNPATSSFESKPITEQDPPSED